MIQITPQMRILLAVEAVDFRKGIDGLARSCREVLKEDPFSGHVFVFRNKRSTSIKVLMYDGQGFWLCQKRLSKGRFRWWPQGGREEVRCPLCGKGFHRSRPKRDFLCDFSLTFRIFLCYSLIPWTRFSHIEAKHSPGTMWHLFGP